MDIDRTEAFLLVLIAILLFVLGYACPQICEDMKQTKNKIEQIWRGN